jgi:hypothetical protein
MTCMYPPPQASWSNNLLPRITALAYPNNLDHQEAREGGRERGREGGGSWHGEGLLGAGLGEGGSVLEAAGVRGSHGMRGGGAAVDVRFVYGDKRRSDTGGKRRESSEALLEMNGWPILYCRGAGHRMHWDEGRGLSHWHPLPLSCHPPSACLLLPPPPPLSLSPCCVSLHSGMPHPLFRPF